MTRRRQDAGKPGEESRLLWNRVKASAAPILRNFVPVSGANSTAPARPSTTRQSVGSGNSDSTELPDSRTATRRKKIAAHTVHDLLHGDAPGVDKRTASRLKKGRLPVEARLDLHGFDREAAQRATTGFIADAQNRGKRCVMIVTGKGKGILQSELPRWLNLAPTRARILSFDHAAPQDGGTGAVYILLKKNRSGSVE